MMDLGIYNDFVEDYNNPQLTLEDIRRKYGLNCRRLSEIQGIAVRKGDVSPVRRMNRTGAKFYTKTNNGYIVKKQFGNTCKFIGRFETQDTAEKVVEECKAHNWNISEIHDFIEKHQIKPKNYTYSDGSYIVQKSIMGKNTVFCKLSDEGTAQRVVSELRKCGWDKTKTKEIIEKVAI